MGIDLSNASTEALLAELAKREGLGEDRPPNVDTSDSRDPDYHEELELTMRARGLGCTWCDSPSCDGGCDEFVDTLDLSK